MIMFQAETVSGLWRASSGFCRMVVMELQKADPRMRRAPASMRIRPPSPSAIRPIPAKERAVPSHWVRPKDSLRKRMASSAVMMGLTLMMKLAGPAETVCSPRLRSTV